MEERKLPEYPPNACRTKLVLLKKNPEKIRSRLWLNRVQEIGEDVRRKKSFLSLKTP